MSKPDKEQLRAQLADLRQQHRDLDAAISGLERAGTGESLD